MPQGAAPRCCFWWRAETSGLRQELAGTCGKGELAPRVLRQGRSGPSRPWREAATAGRSSKKVTKFLRCSQKNSGGANQPGPYENCAFSYGPRGRPGPYVVRVHTKTVRFRMDADGALGRIFSFFLLRTHVEKESRGWTAGIRGVGCMDCLLYTSPSPRDLSTSRMPSSA